MNCLLLTRYGRLGASSRLRCFQYVPFLTGSGFNVTSAPLLDDVYLQRLYTGRSTPWMRVARAYARRLFHLLYARSYDLLWIEKELFPFLPPWFERTLAASGIPYVVDYDDATFHTYDLHPSPVARRLLGRKIDRVMRHASIVVAGNEYLAARAHEAGARRVEILPTVIDLTRYRLPAGEPVRHAVVIGWMGTPPTVKYLLQIRRALETVVQDGRVRIVAVGADAHGLENLGAVSHSWSEATETDEICAFDIGIMPLADAPWERGKCGYKLVQYMACGKPVVASPVGVNAQIVEHGRNGFLADTEAEWIQALHTLCTDANLRRRMGAEGRQRVEAEYALQVTAPRLISLLREAACNR